VTQVPALAGRRHAGDVHDQTRGFRMLDDLSAAHERIDQWESDLSDRMARATELASRVPQMRGTARDPDGVVEASVDSSGVLTDLWLGDSVRHRPSAEIASLIMSTVRAAQSRLADEVAAAARHVYGADSPIAASIAQRMQERFGPGDAAG
jgi:hypothetical protein